MNIDFVVKHAFAGDKLSETLQKKLDRLDKYFAIEPEARVVVKGEKVQQVLEVSVHGPNGWMVRAEESGKTAYDCIEKVLSKLEKQIVRHRDKFAADRQKINDALPIAYEYVEGKDIVEAPEIVKTKTFGVLPIDVKEAVAGLELVDHDFYLFLNEKSGQIEAVYRRADGKIGHLIPEVM